MLEQLIVVDYQEGAGGEFVANWLSAHFGQQLKTDPQKNPDYLQKWLNSHSLVKSDWRKNFADYLLDFNRLCDQSNICRIAVSYHLYKYPEHVEALTKINQARFVRINCQGYESQIKEDFNRKIWNRMLAADDFDEIKFMLHNQDQEKINYCMSLFKQGKLTYRDLVLSEPVFELKHLPSNDVEMLYQDFFINFDRTPAAYNQLCEQLHLTPDARLLNALIDRNKKNLQQRQNHLSTT